MQPVIESKGVFIPHLGIVTASFAAFLVILSLGNPSEIAKAAVDNFSVGLPLTIACLFIPPFKKKYPRLYLPLLYVNSFCVLGGFLLCLLGIHKCFLMVSVQAADRFAFISAMIFIFAFILGIFDAIAETKENSKRKSI